MKNLTLILLSGMLFFGCKKREVEPQSTQNVYSNQFIKYTTFGGWSSWRLENGGVKNVAYYVYLNHGLRDCNDCGAPMIAFEFDPKLSAFELKSDQDLMNATTIKGMTSSIAGPIASRLDSTVISGKKLTDSSWDITIQINKKASAGVIREVFKVVE